MLGDVNGDGTVNESDLKLLQKYLSREVNLSSDQLKSADINQNGEVNESDMKLLQEMIN